jgi:hypothetical protein
VTTFLRNGQADTDKKKFAVIYLDGPGLKIDSTGLTKDATIKISAKAAESTTASEDKTFTLKLIAND